MQNSPFDHSDSGRSLGWSCDKAAGAFDTDRGPHTGGLVRGTNSCDKVDALRKRANEIRAALEAVQAKQRQQEKADDLHVKALIGAAMVADVERADAVDQTKRKTYISDILA